MRVDERERERDRGRGEDREMEMEMERKCRSEGGERKGKEGRTGVTARSPHVRGLRILTGQPRRKGCN